MLTVTGLAHRSGTTVHAVRYYTRLGLLRPERNPDNGYRLYQPREVTGCGLSGRPSALAIRSTRSAKSCTMRIKDNHPVHGCERSCNDELRKIAVS